MRSDSDTNFVGSARVHQIDVFLLLYSALLLPVFDLPLSNRNLPRSACRSSASGAHPRAPATVPYCASPLHRRTPLHSLNRSISVILGFCRSLHFANLSTSPETHNPYPGSHQVSTEPQKSFIHIDTHYTLFFRALKGRDSTTRAHCLHLRSQH